jgi:hypothetical protein
MAEHGKVEYATATGNDMPEHEATYHNVVKITKVAIMATLAVVVALGIHGTTGPLWIVAIGVVAALIAFVRGVVSDTVVPATVVLVALLIIWAFLAS